MSAAPYTLPPTGLLSPTESSPAPDAAKPATLSHTRGTGKPSPFRFSWFTWNQTATTTLLGVGRSNIGGEDDEYNWEFAFTPRYYFVDTPKHQAYVNARIGWQTELTNSNTTTKLHQTLFEDLELGAGYAYTLYASRDDQTKVSPGISGGLVFPTSKASANSGKYLGTKLSFSPRAQIKLLGEDAKGLNSAIVYATATWSHLFSRASTPTNESLATSNYSQDPVPVQTVSGSAMALQQSDQMSMSAFAHDKLKLSFGYFLPLYGDLYFNNSWAISEEYKYPQTGGTVQLPTGTARVADISDPSSRGVRTTFDVSLSYDFFDSSLRWDIGYQNDAAQLGEDGRRRSMFYSPTAAFYMDIIVLFDGVYKQVDKRVNKSAMNRLSHHLTF